eukprot:TRINITY_DN5633_c0_g1_i6.p2 TRINITY_DN5633_c0_g1~~TRINITY_DN5633_c0_g1_i6.p2  ORF type:complete len:193 (-),score=38.01 TRINITY_DN5633_c0_g1_i6:641-1219(-)
MFQTFIYRHNSFFFFKQKTAYEIMPSLVGSEMCIRDRYMGDKIITTPLDDNTKFTIREYRDRLYQEISKKKEEKCNRLRSDVSISGSNVGGREEEKHSYDYYAGSKNTNTQSRTTKNSSYESSEAGSRKAALSASYYPSGISSGYGSMTGSNSGSSKNSMSGGQSKAPTSSDKPSEGTSGRGMGIKCSQPHF